MNFTNDELNLICIYNTDTRESTMDALVAMREFLEDDEAELRDMTDSVVDRLEQMNDEEFDALELFPDFEE